MADLELTLAWLGIDRYLERFVEAGFDSWATVLEITENDLDILNVDLGHRRKLQREIANTKRLARDPAFVTPLYGIDPSPPSNVRGISSSSTDAQQGDAPTKRVYGSGTTSPRVRQACRSCRKRNIKCHGEQPTCRHCREFGVECNYASGKPDRRGRQIDNILQKLKVYEDLLLKFVPQVDDGDQQAIQDAILMPPQGAAAKSVHKETTKSESTSDSHGGGGESDASGVGSMGSTDRVDQDDVQQRQVPAFVGQSSEIRWTERLSKELLPKQSGKSSKSQNLDPGLPQNASQRLGGKEPPPYVDDMDSAIVGHQIDPFSLPVKPTADSLVDSYFSTAHLSFPILNKMDFIDQYDELYRTMDPEGFEPRTFVATLQLVFAIAAVHAHLIQADWTGDARDHTLYFSQARVLAVDTGIFNDDCYLSQVQVFGLGGMYLLITNHLNRAWNLSGLAIRSAQALGLHLKDVSGSINTETKDFRAYNWFALLTLESMLTLMTGRPTMINSRDCSVIIPGALAEEKSTSTTRSPSESPEHRSKTENEPLTSSPGMSDSGQGVHLNKHHTSHAAAVYFVHHVEICELAMEAVGELYQPGIRKKKWSQIQSRIESFNRRLFEWKDGVKPPLNVASPSHDPETESCRVALRILFHSTRIIINRPCLCRIWEHIRDQSSSSEEMNRTLAKNCIDSARSTLSLILHKPDSTVLHDGTMWWMLTHHLKRAVTVLLLELAFRTEIMPADADGILAQAKGAVNWLNHVGRSSPEARRSWSNMRRLLRLTAQKFGGDTSDIMTSSEEEAAPFHLGYQQPPLATDDNEATPQEQWQYYDDLNARNELDPFGFMRAASENEKMSEGQEKDDDMEGSS